MIDLMNELLNPESSALTIDEIKLILKPQRPLSPEDQPPEGHFVCPFVIAIDQREKLPYAFVDLKCDAKLDRKPIFAPCRITHLKTGDYTIDGMADRCAVERKSLDDLYGTLGGNRDRFVRELERLAKLEIAWVVVEAEWSEILGHPPIRSELNPKTVVRSVQAWMVRYPTVHWVCCPGREFAEAMTFRLLERFWMEEQKRKKEAEKKL